MKRRHKTLRSTDGFTLTELMIVIAVIGTLAAIAIPLYGNTQRQARVAKAQADLRTLAGAVGMFAVQCGDVPQSPRTWTAAVNSPNGTAACSLVVTRSVRRVTQRVTDANGVADGPFLQELPVPPAGWTYVYTPGPTADAFTLVGTSPTDLPGGRVTYP